MTSENRIEFEKKVFYASLHTAALTVFEEQLGIKPTDEDIAYAINDEMDGIQIGPIHQLAVLITAGELRQVLEIPLTRSLVKREYQRGITLLRKKLRRIGLTI